MQGGVFPLRCQYEIAGLRRSSPTPCPLPTLRPWRPRAGSAPHAEGGEASNEVALSDEELARRIRPPAAALDLTPGERRHIAGQRGIRRRDPSEMRERRNDSRYGRRQVAKTVRGGLSQWPTVRRRRKAPPATSVSALSSNGRVVGRRDAAGSGYALSPIEFDTVGAAVLSRGNRAAQPRRGCGRVR